MNFSDPSLFSEPSLPVLLDFLMHEAIDMQDDMAESAREQMDENLSVPVTVMFGTITPEGSMKMVHGCDHISFPTWAEDGTNNAPTKEWNSEVRRAVGKLTAFATIFVMEADIRSRLHPSVKGVLLYMSCPRGNRILMVPADPADAANAKALSTGVLAPGECNLAIFEGVFPYHSASSSEAPS